MRYPMMSPFGVSSFVEQTLFIYGRTPDRTPRRGAGCEFIEARGDRVRRVQGYIDRLTILNQLGLATS